ncbi:hypothetical protein [Ketobacter alkanivorans]|uniref:Uncharacterized protein n=1 Tax=Ketobacter alkanivorans TaxID=1917421 RepID=A0A2K9LL99_9GAMM|nr:hypothetical protein [Ketobacter alkanivorans]AUM13033.1 hypothetical protein Kalk_11630 [Ketobacter alkanivorans]
MMKIPRKNKHWAQEIEKALEASISSLTSLDELSKQSLFKLAVPHVIRNRGLSKKDVPRDLGKDYMAECEQGLKVDPEAIKHYETQFIIAYVDAHREMGLINERKLDEIVEFVLHHHVYTI